MVHEKDIMNNKVSLIGAKVLITSWSLADWGGAAINALELGKYLKQIGAEVDFFSYDTNGPMSKYISGNLGFNVFTDYANDMTIDENKLNHNSDIDIDNYDYIWVGGNQLPISIIKGIASKKKLPKFVFLHMSALVNFPLDAPLLPDFEKKVATKILAISESAREKNVKRILGESTNVELYCNPAPEEFKQVKKRSGKLERIAVISSSNPPKEILDIASNPELANIQIDFIGKYCDNEQVVDAEFYDKYDLIIGIGKNVQYSLVSGVPVYIYGRFNGCGYLNSNNFNKCAYDNFSGRGFSRKTSTQIANEIVKGYKEAIKYYEKNRIKWIDNYSISNVVDRILEDLGKKQSKSIVLSNNETSYIISMQLLLLYTVGSIRNRSLLIENQTKLIELNAEKTRLMVEVNKLKSIKETSKQLINNIKKRIARNVKGLTSVFRKIKIVGICSYRFDEDYLEDWKKNLSPLCSEFVINYDKDGVFLKDEGAAREKLYNQARKLGGDWAVVIDPDERLEKPAIKKIKRLIRKNNNKKVILKFNIRELYECSKYRVDGIWGNKKRCSVFPLRDDNIYATGKIHIPLWPINDDFEIINTNLNIYHLKHIKPEFRKQRAKIYKHLDPEQKLNGLAGYDYLDDENGMILEKIPKGRGYSPKCRDYKMMDDFFDLSKIG